MNKNIILWTQRICAIALLIATATASVWVGDGTALLIVAPLSLFLFFTKKIELWTVRRTPERKPDANDIGVLNVSESELERASDYLTNLIRGCGYDRATMINMTAERFDVPRGVIEWMIA